MSHFYNSSQPYQMKSQMQKGSPKSLISLVNIPSNVVNVFCFQTDLTLTSSVSAGAELAIRECADQFRAEVWNCPVTAFRSRREERGNNRETAYIQAITAAAVTHTLTRNCSQGSLLVRRDS